MPAAFLTLIFIQLTFGLSSSTFLLLPKYMAVELGAGPVSIGVVSGAFSLVGIALVPWLGAAIRRFGPRACITAGTALMAVASAGFAAVHAVGPFIFTLRAMHGLAWALTFNAGLVLTYDLVAERSDGAAMPGGVGQAIGIFGLSNLVTNAFAPGFAEPIAEELGYRVVFWAAAGLATVACGIATRLPRPHRSPAPDEPAPRMTALLARPGKAAVVAAILVAGVAFGMMFTFHQPFAISAGVRNVRSFFIAYTAAAVVVRLVAGGLVDRWGHQRAAAVSLALYGTVVAVMGLLGPGHLAVIGGAFGVAHGFFFPASTALVMAHLGAAERPRLLAFANGASAAGQSVVVLLGPMVGRVGYSGAFVTCGLVTVASTALLLRRPARTGSER